MIKKRIIGILILTASVMIAEELTVPEIPPPVTITGEAPPENTILGIPEKEFIQAQAAITATASSPEVAQLTEQIEQLIDQRDALMVLIALQRNPERKVHIETISNAIKGAKKLRGVSGP